MLGELELSVIKCVAREIRGTNLQRLVNNDVTLTLRETEECMELNEAYFSSQLALHPNDEVYKKIVPAMQSRHADCSERLILKDILDLAAYLRTACPEDPIYKLYTARLKDLREQNQA